MTRILALTLAAALMATAAQAVGPAQAQLVASLGLTDEQAAKLTTHQLVLLKHIKESPTLSEDEKRRRSKWILKGVVPRFQFNF